VALYEHQESNQTPVGRADSVSRTRRFSPGQIISGVVGVVLVVFGIIAVTRTGIDSSLNTPPTDIMGLAHSAYVGLAEILTGLLLVLAAADLSMRPLTGIVGVLLFIGGIVVAAGTNEMLLRIGTERATGWFLMIMGAIAVVAALLPSFVRSRRETVTQPVS
jgi:uncharacterized membrane protein HdeD (DUF308 family)